jgi:hypothetical protein
MVIIILLLKFDLVDKKELAPLDDLNEAIAAEDQSKGRS